MADWIETECEKVVCDICGFTSYNYGSTGTRTMRCDECRAEQRNMLFGQKTEETYYEDEDEILRGKCSIHGEFIGDAIGCPECFALEQEQGE